MKANAAHVAFNRGEVCKEGLGRVDNEKMALAAATQVNWLPWAIGPMMLRPGLEYIGGTRGNAKTKLLRFVFARDDTAQIELTDSLARVRVADLLVTRNAVATTVASGDMSTSPTTVTTGLNANSVDNFWAGKTGRQVIKGSDLVAGNQLQITLAGSTTRSTIISHVFIGKKTSTYGFASTPTPVTFFGLVPVSILQGGTVTSDPINIAVDGVTDYVVSWYESSGSSRDLATKSGWQAYYKAGDDASTVAAKSYTTYATGVALVSAISLYPTSSADWDITGTTAGCTALVAGGVMTLTCTAIGGLAQVKQALTIATADQNVEQAIRVTVTDGPVTLRIGSTDGIDDYVSQTEIDTGVHSLAFTPTQPFAYLQIESTDSWPKTLTSVQVEAAGTLELPTPWAAADLPNVRYDASADVIFCASAGVRQHKIERRSTRSWSVVEYKSVNGPFASAPGRADCRLTPSATCGSVTLSSSLSYFNQGHVGALFRLFNPGQTLGQTLGAEDSWTPAIRVQGVGVQRNFNFKLNGTFTGTVTIQQSFDGPDAGWVDVTGTTGSKVDAGSLLTNFLLAQNTGGTRLDNVIVWYRAGFKSGQYTSGSVVVSTDFAGGGAYGVGRLTAVLDTKTAIASVIEPFASTNSTTDWVQQQWSDDDGYPTSVVFIEGRLGWFGTSIWLSESDEFDSFANIDSTGQDLGDSGAINLDFGSGPVDVIPWALALQRLIVGREMSIASARSSALDTPLTPTDIVLKDCSTQGAARLPAAKVDQNGIYVQGSGRKVYEVSFLPQRFDYGTADLTRLNLDIGKTGFTTLEVQHQPDVYMHLPRGDGQSASLLYEPNEDLACWWRIQTLGVIEDCCVMPSADGLEDKVDFVVRRLINGETVRFIERLALRDNCVGGLVNQIADAHIVYSGAPTRQVMAAHLPNTTAVVWADGADVGTATSDATGLFTMPGTAEYSNVVLGLGGTVQSNSGTDITSLTVGSAYEGMPAVLFADNEPAGSAVVTGGVLTLPDNRTADTIIACLGFVAPFMSAKLAYGAQLGTALNQVKKIDHIGLVAYDIHYQGVRYGQSFDDEKLSDLPLSADGVATTEGKIWSEFDKATIPLGGSWDTDARLCLLAQAPRPAKIGSVVISIDTVEKAA
jgi:hypothetical protein